MNLLKLAFGLIREAAGTPVGREVIHDVWTSSRREADRGPAIDIQGLLAEHRAEVNENLERVVESLNEQNARLAETIRRQRIWNRALSGGLILTFIAAMVAIWNSYSP